MFKYNCFYKLKYAKKKQHYRVIMSGVTRGFRQSFVYNILLNCLDIIEYR